VINASGLASLDAGIDVDGVFTVADTTGNVSTTGTLAVTGITTLTDDLAVDTDTLFVDVSTDRVGINKAVPTVALDVTGDITSSATIHRSNFNRYTFNSSPNEHYFSRYVKFFSGRTYAHRRKR
jgi:phosphoribosyl 1,2-cyclic phosphodiesterase